MKFSIIIATLNNEDTILRNLQSIKNQNYKDYEIIIIDGGSNDKTIDRVKKIEFENLNIKSQNGTGVYNAFNEGIISAIGEIIVILNADDFFEEKNALEKISNEFDQDENLSLLMSNIKIINKKKQTLRIYKNNFFKNFMFYFGMMPPHPGIFVKKKVYENFGLFNEDFKNAGDFEFLLRVIGKNKIRYKKIDNFLVNMSHGGKSNKNFKSYFINTIEIKRALKINNYFSSYLLIIIRLFIKLFQYRRINL